MAATRKFLIGSGGLGMWSWVLLIPVGTILESQRARGIPENKILVLKDAAQLQNLRGFLLLLIFWGFILNKYSSQSRTNPNPSSSTALDVGEAHGCDHSLVRLFLPFVDSSKGNFQMGAEKGLLCSITVPGKYQNLASLVLWCPSGTHQCLKSQGCGTDRQTDRLGPEKVHFFRQPA